MAAVLGLALPLTAQDATDAIRLEGRAVDPRGRPLDDVELRWVWSNQLRVGDVLVRTGDDGTFAVDADRSWFRIVQRIDTPGLLVSRRGRTSVSLSVWPEEVQGATRHEVGDVVLQPGVNLRGTIRDADGNPVAGAVAMATDAAAFSQMSQFGGMLSPLSIGFGEKMPFSLARSDADGRFELRGVLPIGTRIQVRKPGYAMTATAPIALGDRIEVVLEPTGTARGTVVDPGGAPVPDALVYLFDEAGSFVMSRSAPDGAFSLPLPTRNRYHVEAQKQLQVTSQPGDTKSGWREAPGDDLRIVPIDLSQDTPGFPVRVVDAESGEPIPGAQVAVGWQEYFVSIVRSIAELEGWIDFGSPAEDGVPRARGPAEGEDEKGAIIVRAPGHAVAAVAVEWKAGGIQPTVELQRGARLTGRIVAAETGEPVPDALVHATPKGLGEGDLLRYAGPKGQPVRSTTRTDATGAFELTDLPPGENVLTVLRNDRPSPEPRRIELRGGETLSDVEIEMPRGAIVEGRVSGAGITSGLWVRLRRDTDDFVAPGGMTSMDGSVRAARVAADGRYALHGVAAGSWDVEVVAQAAQLGASTHAVAVGKLEVGVEDRSHDIQVPALTPGRVSGTVECAGAAIPSRRLVVFAESRSQNESVRFYSAVGLRTYVDRSGSYEMTLPPSEWVLHLHDTVTGVRLATADAVEVPASGNVHCDLRADCGAVRVRFVAASDDDPFVGQRVSIAPAEGDANPGMFFGLVSAWLPARPGEHVVFLPLERHELEFWAVRAGEGNPLMDPINRNGAPTKTVTVRPRAHEVVEVELRAPGR